MYSFKYINIFMCMYFYAYFYIYKRMFTIYIYIKNIHLYIYICVCVGGLFFIPLRLFPFRSSCASPLRALARPAFQSLLRFWNGFL